MFAPCSHFSQQHFTPTPTGNLKPDVQDFLDCEWKAENPENVQTPHREAPESNPSTDKYFRNMCHCKRLLSKNK